LISISVPQIRDFIQPKHTVATQASFTVATHARGNSSLIAGFVAVYNTETNWGRFATRNMSWLGYRLHIVISKSIGYEAFKKGK
jgi:hypothetical protein